MVFRTCHLKTCNRLRTIPHVCVCIGCFTLCLLSLQMEIDRARSFAQERLCWQLRAVTAGVSVYKTTLTFYSLESLMVITFSQDVLCEFSGFLIRDDCNKPRERQREIIKVT